MYVGRLAFCYQGMGQFEKAITFYAPSVVIFQDLGLLNHLMTSVSALAGCWAGTVQPSLS